MLGGRCDALEARAAADWATESDVLHARHHQRWQSQAMRSKAESSNSQSGHSTLNQFPD
jgi:hypothetical protein